VFTIKLCMAGLGASLPERYAIFPYAHAEAVLGDDLGERAIPATR